MSINLEALKGAKPLKKVQAAELHDASAPLFKQELDNVGEVPDAIASLKYAYDQNNNIL